MAWAVQFTSDTEIKEIGTLTVSNDGFVYSQRIKVNDTASVEAFVADARSKFAALTIENTDKNTIEQAVLIALEK